MQTRVNLSAGRLEASLIKEETFFGPLIRLLHPSRGFLRVMADVILSDRGAFLWSHYLKFATSQMLPDFEYISRVFLSLEREAKL